MLDPIGLAAAAAVAGAIIGYLLGKSSRTKEEPPEPEPEPIIVIEGGSINIESPVALARWRQNPSHMGFPKFDQQMRKVTVNGKEAAAQPAPNKKNILKCAFQCAGEQAEALTLESGENGKDLTLHSAGVSFEDPGWVKKTYTWTYRLPVEKVVVTLETAGSEKREIARGEKVKVEVH
jgi:hypothetical protein